MTSSSKIKGWHARTGEAGVYPVAATWREVWPLMAKAQATEGGTADLKAWLWRHRYASWMASLDEDSRSCRYCGDLKTSDRKGRLFCSDACRVSAHQASDRGSEWPLQAVVRAAGVELFLLSRWVEDAQSWLDGPEAPAIILPPDLACLDNLPPLPDRCERGCAGKPCRWTRSGPCLFANTAQET